jgi:hypothetical protein
MNPERPAQNPPLLRVTSGSNRPSAVLGLVLSIPLLLAFAVFAIASWKDNFAFSLVFGFGAAVLAAGAFKSLSGILSPFENELVIEPDQLRFGRTDRPEQQKIISRSAIRCLSFDDGCDPSLSVDMGKSIAPLLAPDIVRSLAHMVAVVAVVRAHWSEVPVYSREEFQDFCRRRHSKDWR